MAAGLVVFFESPTWILAASAAGFALTTAYHLARWLTFQISVNPGELRTSHVFVARTDRRIPIASIHDLHFEQSLLQRILGVVTVRIETAGGSGTEAELPGLLRRQAEALKRAIDDARVAGGPAPEPVAPPPEHAVVALGARELVIAGISSATIWIVGGALASSWFFLEDLVPGLEDRLAPAARSAAGFVASAGVLTLVAGTLALVCLLLIAAAVVSVGRTFVQFYGFRVTWNGARLLRECGLLTTRRQVLHATRIQRILIRQRWLQRWLDCVSIELGTAASASGDGGDKGRKFVIPIVPVSGVQPILDLLAPGAEPIDGQFERVSPLASRRYLVRSALAFLPVSAGVAFWHPWAAPLVWIGFVRNLIRAPRLAIVGGSRATGDLVQFRSGAFSRRLVTLPLRRVQGISLERTVFDRRLGLATLRVFGAGSGNAGWLRDLPEARARALAAAVVAGAPGADPRAT